MSTIQDDLFAHNTIVIEAPAETIWAKLLAATAWPTWYSNASHVVVNDPSGTGDQIRAYHTWLLIPRNGTSTYVVRNASRLPCTAAKLPNPKTRTPAAGARISCTTSPSGSSRRPRRVPSATNRPGPPPGTTIPTEPTPTTATSASTTVIP
jgi:hypothetical protein